MGYFQIIPLNNTDICDKCEKRVPKIEGSYFDDMLFICQECKP